MMETILKRADGLFCSCCSNFCASFLCCLLHVLVHVLFVVARFGAFLNFCEPGNHGWKARLPLSHCRTGSQCPAIFHLHQLRGTETSHYNGRGTIAGENRDNHLSHCRTGSQCPAMVQLNQVRGTETSLYNRGGKPLQQERNLDYWRGTETSLYNGRGTIAVGKCSNKECCYFVIVILRVAV